MFFPEHKKDPKLLDGGQLFGVKFMLGMDVKIKLQVLIKHVIMLLKSLPDQRIHSEFFH